MSAVNQTRGRPIYYDKIYDLDTKDWGIVQNRLSSRAKVIHSGLTEAEVDAWLKLLKEN